VTPVDTRLGALGGTTFRRSSGDVIDDQLIRETESARMELEQLRAELRETSGKAKSNVEAAIDAQRRKLEGLVDRVDQTLAEQKAEFEARIATLREQQAKARESQRQRIAARMDELKASYEARGAKLEEARRLAKASVEATREALVP
jgi:molecular chaperone DnaK (HSP70)